MPKIEIKTLIDSDVKTCFDLARDIDFHQKSLEHSKESALAGKISGLIELGEWVTWEAFHFGIKQKLTSKITVLESPTYFVDEMVSGAFKSFKHEHIFEEKNLKTVTVDRFYFESPLGILGRFINQLFLEKYVRNLLAKRTEILKHEAEKRTIG